MFYNYVSFNRSKTKNIKGDFFTNKLKDGNSWHAAITINDPGLPTVFSITSKQ